MDYRPTAHNSGCFKQHPFLTIIMLISLSLVIWVAHLAIKEYAFIQSSQVAAGRLINQTNGESTDPEDFFLKIAFTSADGKNHVMESRFGAGFYSYNTPEDTISFLYLPENPDNATIDDFISLWGILSVIGGISGFFLIISTIPLLRSLRHSRNQQWLYSNGHFIEARII